MKFPTISNEKAAHLKKLRDIEEDLKRDLAKAFGLEFVNIDDYARAIEKQLGPALRAVQREMLDG